ncbi:MAG: hypothetical protein V1792_14865 [Pseudomonadota bacterium]
MTLRCGRVWLYVFVVALAIAPLTVLAGGPPSADLARTQDPGTQTPQSAPPATGGTDGQGSQGYGISGGVGFASVAGGIGTSPQLNLAYTGERQFAWYTKIYTPWFSFDGAKDIRLSGELLWFKFKGPDTYDGQGYSLVSGFSLWHDDHIETTLDAHYWRLNADMSMATLGALRVGPRLQYFIYSDLFRIQNLTPPREGVSEETRHYGMPGIGVFASLDLGSMAPGASLGFSPRLNLAATMGKGSGMRYDSWEAVAEILVRPGQMGISSLPLPGILLQAGYIYIKITETNESIEPVVFPGDLLRTDRADYHVKYPLLRASISF